MPRAANPKSADLTLFLRSTRLPFFVGMDDEELAGLYDTPSIMLASIAEWERQTRYTPFKAETQTLYFDAPGSNQGNGLYGQAWGTNEYFPDDFGCGGFGAGGQGDTMLPLQCGLLSVDSLTVGISASVPGGTALTEGTDFWLEPDSAPRQNKPYSYIRFARIVAGLPKRIKIIGKFGYSLTVPDDAWLAMIQYGAGLLMQQIGISVHGGLKARTAGDEQQQFSETAFKTLSDAWQNNFDRTVQRYRRISL